MSDKEQQKDITYEQQIAKNEWKKYGRMGISFFLTFVACVLFFFIVLRYQQFAAIIGQLIHAAQPIIMGLVIAYLINPVMKFCERHVLRLLTKKMKSEKKAKKAARIIGVTGAIVFLLAVIALMIAAIVPSVVNSITTLAETMPKHVESFTEMLEKKHIGNSKVTALLESGVDWFTTNMDELAQDLLVPTAQTYIVQITTGVISGVKTVCNFVIGIVVAIYAMMIQETLQGQSKKIVYAIFKPRYGNVIIHTVRKSSKIFGGFISGKIIDSAIIGVLCYIGCLILRMPDSMLIAVIIGVTNIIPFFGPIIGAIPTVLLVLIQDPWKALYLLIFIIFLQQLDGNVIGPKILGDSTGLSSFWVMFAILFSGSMWGFFGMLLGVPSFAVVYYIVGKAARYGVSKKHLPESTEAYIKARGVNEKTNTLRYTKLGETEEKPDEKVEEKTDETSKKN